MIPLLEQKKKITWNKDLKSLYARFPSVIRTNLWPKIMALVAANEVDNAWEMAKQAEDKNPQYKAQNVIGRAIRLKRMELFKRLNSAERELKNIFNNLAEKLALKVEVRATSTGKSAGLQKEAELTARELRVEIRKWLLRLLKDSAAIALKNSSDVMQPILKDMVDVTKEELKIIEDERAIFEEPLNFKTVGTKKFNAATPLWSKKWQGVQSKIVSTILKSNKLGIPAEKRIVELSQRASNEMKKIIANNIAQGVAPAVTARKIKTFLSPQITLAIERGEELPRGVYRSVFKNAMRLARTESSRAYTYASAEWAKNKSFIKGVRINLSSRHEEEDICDDLAARGVMSPGEAQGLIPAHPHNILPDQLVLAPDMIAATKAFYEGGCIEVCFADGRKFSVTQGHPILTSRGWVLAKELTEFDKVIFTSDIQGVAAGINPNYEQRPTAIEDVFSAFKKSGKVSSSRMKVSSEDFDGDGEFIKGEIDIIRANGFLWSDLKSSISKIVNQSYFYGRDILRDSFQSFSAINFRSQAGFASALGNIRVSGDTFPFGQGHSGIHSFQTSLGMNTSRLGLAKNINTVIGQRFSDRVKRSSILASQFTNRFSAFITENAIVSIKRFFYSGHVYDLQCQKYSLFNCNGAIVSNCMCTITYEIEDRFLDKGND